MFDLSDPTILATKKALHNQLDSNGDVSITAAKKMLAAHQFVTCPYEHGSLEAKQWWYQVMEPAVKAAVTPAMKAKYGDQITGVFNGKPMINGIGVGHGDFDHLVSKLQVTHGYSELASKKIAGSIAHKLYGK